MGKDFLEYNRELKGFSRDLRKESTPGEVEVWKRLKGKRIKGYGFNRQKPIENFIVDFYCKKLNLVIEIDGRSHLDKKERDQIKDRALEESGLKVIRFTEAEAVVKPEMIENAILKIIEEFEERTSVS